MARETALAFFRKVHEDRTLRQRLDRVRPRDISGLLRFAADAGYLFTARDYRAALELNGELTDATKARLASGRFVIPGLTLQPESGD